MGIFADRLKTKLIDSIRDVVSASWLFVRKPGKDFTRKRKLPMIALLRLVLSMGGASLNRELLSFFDYNTAVPTTAAFIRQREKILPEAFDYLFRDFTDKLRFKEWHGYRLLAVDGSDIVSCANAEDGASFIRREGMNGYNITHLNTLFDLRSRLYVDFINQPTRNENERAALIEMVGRLECGRGIIIADRNYESYNVFKHIEARGLNYLIRVKDVASSGILAGLTLPDGEFDVAVKRILTNRQTNAVKADPGKYRYLPNSTPLDFYDADGYCPIGFRVVRFAIPGGFEAVITNLPADEFPPDTIRELYAKRWGIETSFRELKYTIGLNALHSKKADSISQEIAARLVMYNFCESIAAMTVINNGNRKYAYKVNFSAAVDICLALFRWNGPDLPDAETLIVKYLTPLRERSFERKVSSKGVVSFMYRIA